MGEAMRGLSVVIPSKTASNLAACTRSVVQNQPSSTRIFVMDDGVDWTEFDTYLPFRERMDEVLLEKVRCENPFIFARNCNLGIAKAGDDDVVILNDDALLQTPGGFSLLQQAAEEHPEYGIIGATTNVTGQPLQYRQNIGLREVPHIAFVCVYVPRRTINTVGMLDERFTTYGWEDNDYCRRVKLAGLKIGVYDHCFVDHGSLVSTFRGHANNAGDIEPGRKIFQEKWGTA